MTCCSRRLASLPAAPTSRPTQWVGHRSTGSDAVPLVHSSPHHGGSECVEISCAHKSRMPSPGCPGLRASALAGKVSLAAKGMCLWVRAMETYGYVAKDVGPKRAKLQAAQEALARKEAALATAQEQLTAVLAKVAALREK